MFSSVGRGYTRWMRNWEEARRSIYPLPGGVTTQRVPLEFIAPAPCVACGDTAETGYAGRPFHMICAIELAFYIELVKRGERPMLPGLQLTGPDALELPVGR